MPYRFVLLVLLCLPPGRLCAQDTLPNFNVLTRDKKKILLRWYNPFPDINQINIQRSSDSLRNFKTILAVPDPDNLDNGFVDSKAPNANQYYRLFISFKGGAFLFSTVKKPGFEPETGVNGPPVRAEQENANPVSPAPAVKTAPAPETNTSEKRYIIKKKDSILARVNQATLNLLRDSIRSKTRDTLVFRKGDTILIKPFVQREVFRPSSFVYTNREGNVTINLSDTDHKKYSILFFEENNTFFFRISQVKDSPLIIDKANFLQSGWYQFELYEEGKLKEKNKFYIPRDF